MVILKEIARLSNMKNLIRDLPKGRLDVYRKRASFDWKLLKLNVEGEECISFQNRLWSFIEKDPIFLKSDRLTLDDTRRICNARILKLYQSGFVDPLAENDVFHVLFQYDSSMAVKMGIMYGLTLNIIFSLGTQQHTEYIEKIYSGECTCCFALTEISHGTNAKGMRTTATYDVQSKSFIIRTPDFEAAKCWVGALGKVATHAILFAQLITPDGKCHGLHSFIVPLRDPKTHTSLSGVIVGDMGEKIGLNGVDNGFVMFNDYRVPRSSLLNRTADVTEDGQYVTSVKDESKRFGASLGALSAGRVMITLICMNYASLATVIAIRYCAVRKQFGPTDSEELPVIEYQAQHCRLLPHLAAVYAMKIFATTFTYKLQEFNAEVIASEDRSKLSDEGMEIHGLSCATKPLCAWTSRDIIQDCRESCGGHGYLKMSRLGDIRADNDANCTYEGENNVLTQQTSNWLVNQWANVLNGKRIVSPFGTVDFLPNAKNILAQKCRHATPQEFLTFESLLSSFKWLVCYYLKKTYDHVQDLKAKGYSDFEVRNDSQTFRAQTLSLLYAQHYVLKTFVTFLEETTLRVEEYEVLKKLCTLYGATLLEKRLIDLYAGGYVSPESRVDTILREGIITLCKELVPEAVALVDVLSPPDFILNSALGMADGEVYKHMKERFFKDNENLERPSWWKEILKAKM